MRRFVCYASLTGGPLRPGSSGLASLGQERATEWGLRATCRHNATLQVPTSRALQSATGIDKDAGDLEVWADRKSRWTCRVP